MLQIYLFSSYIAFMYHANQILMFKVTCYGFLIVGLFRLLALNMKNIVFL